MVSDRTMNGDGFLKMSHDVDAAHGPFSPPRRQVGILGSVIVPAARLRSVSLANARHCGTARSQLVGHKATRKTTAFHQFPDEIQCRLAITAQGHVASRLLAIVVDGAPEIVRFSTDLLEQLVQVPLQVRICFLAAHPPTPGLSCKHQAETGPQVAGGVMAEADAAFMQQIFDVPQRQWK